MLKVKQVTKAFGNKDVATLALAGVNLEIYDGELLSIMGPSGCGKSTLLNVMSGIEAADSGEVWLDDVPLHKLNDKKLSDLRLEQMGFVFQQYHLIPVLSAIDNVALPLIAKGMVEVAAHKAAMEALELVGLSDKQLNMPAQLSGGQAQRVAIARAIAGNAKIVWADEPTGALDSGNSKQIMDLFRELNSNRRTTFVIVTHDRQIASRTDRTVYMKNGIILKEAGDSDD
ncbi:ABC transporter ATP-binding protein [Paenibacillus donghaensis]|uniref:Macrolide ABC transporter ATP-binding protein n=1 Tax=Paenibacillus donghaensis TaxID=414771 RepID=A0A2Z2KC29_9BACL|nr:ABC transporter ATP-binding protein [Paenibacillus donghaensis]ASA19469.1 macrolide ABC transporter ATP-binding protein [Paenibacillus donghaensis]